jgi:hypothetical protein
MNKPLIAFAAVAGFAIAGLAITPAAAAPIAPKQLGFTIQHAGNQIEQVRHNRRRAHRPHYRFSRRHFWAPGPWAFRGLPYHHCFRVRGGYVCYF